MTKRDGSGNDPRLDRVGSSPDYQPGMLLRVRGERGVFRFQEVWLPDGSLTMYGPVSSDPEKGRGQWRSFRPDRVVRRDRAAERMLNAVEARLEAGEAEKARRRSEGAKRANAARKAADAPAAVSDDAAAKAARRSEAARKANATRKARKLALAAA